MSRHSLFSKMDSEELVGNAEGQCGPIDVSGCTTTPSHLNLGVFTEGKKTAIVQNSVSQ